MTDEQMALVAKALSHPARIRIISLLAAQTECRGHDVFAGLPLAQSTISEHLRVLREVGLVTSRPAGTAMVYCLAPIVLNEFCGAIAEVVSDSPTCVTNQGGC